MALKSEDLNKLTRSADSISRFWAVRDQAYRIQYARQCQTHQPIYQGSFTKRGDCSLRRTLRTGNKAHIEMATLRLLELADVEEYGHFSAIAAFECNRP